MSLPCSAQGGTAHELHLRWATVEQDSLQVHDHSAEFSVYPQGGGQASITQGSPALVWRKESDGSWIAETASLGNEATQVFTEFGSFYNQAMLLSSHAADASVAAWSDNHAMYNFVRDIASSSEADVHVSVHQEFTDSTNSVRHAVLRKYSSSMATPDWSYSSAVLISNHTHSWVGVSANGETIVLLVYDAAVGSTRASVFGAGSNTPLSETLLPTMGGFETATLSADGSTLLISSPHRQLVVDVATQTITFSLVTLAQGQYGDAAISADGASVALGTPGDFTVFTRDSQGAYSEAYVFPLPPATMARGLALSADGSILIAGVQSFSNLNTARFLAIDVASQSVLLDFEVQGTGNFQNLIEDIQCSADGNRFAVGLWGDEDNLVPEVLVYDIHSNTPLLAEHLTGSVNELSLSANGEWLAVAAKGTHANVWGTGGAVSFYRVGLVDVSVSGMPTLGANVSVEHQLRSGTRSRVLVSSALLDVPLQDSSYGSGALYIDPASIVALPDTYAGSDHVARAPFALPGQPGDVGLTYYLQAVDVDSGKLSRDWVKLTVLP